MGAVMAHVATRDDHLIIQDRVGCCRMSQGAFSMYCVAAVFFGLGFFNYLGQRVGSIDVCLGPTQLEFGVGYGFLICLISWGILCYGCHEAKLARDIQEDIPTPEPYIYNDEGTWPIEPSPRPSKALPGPLLAPEALPPHRQERHAPQRQAPVAPPPAGRPKPPPPRTKAQFH